MGYLHINNLYKEQTILMFRECYALEKIHGTSAHIKWNSNNKVLNFFSGGESHKKFTSLFKIDSLYNYLLNNFIDSDVIIYGEAYGGSQQRMSKTYGENLKFIAFDVKINQYWLSVTNAENVCQKLDIEFVDYVKISTDLESINFERDKDSVQAIRNGCGLGKIREGIVLRSLQEFIMNNGDRIISKHKRDEFKETKTQREVSPEYFKVLEDSKEIAEEWVTEMRLHHVLDKINATNLEQMSLVIKSMIDDVYREAKGEIIESKEVTRSIGSKTASLYKNYLKNNF